MKSPKTKSMDHVEMSNVYGDRHDTRDVLELARLGKMPILKVSETLISRRQRY